MQRSQRVSDDGTVPGYLRTHPVTTERIADAQNKRGAAVRSIRTARNSISCARSCAGGQRRAQDTVTPSRSAERSATPTKPPPAMGWQRAGRARRVWPPPRLVARATGTSSPMVWLRARAPGEQRCRGRGRCSRQACALSDFAGAALCAGRGCRTPAQRAGDRASNAGAQLPGDPRLRALQSRLYAAPQASVCCSTRQASTLRVAGQPARSHRAAAASPRRGRRRLLPARWSTRASRELRAQHSAEGKR